MKTVGKTRKGEYFDSVTLMTVGKAIAEMEGVMDAAVVMGTKENKAILSASGLLTPELEGAGDTDLVIAFKLEDESKAGDIMAAVDEALKRARKKVSSAEEFHPMSFEAAVDVLPEANLAVISVAGRYAGDLAKRALEKGLHVMVFSDHVPLEIEIELKQLGKKKGLIVMGPDCGTAIINGVPLGFANVVNRGEIGIVAAAGTGLQEVSTIISEHDGGISQAIGTGGRDISEEVDGIMFLEAMKALADDPMTAVMLLVSKPPHPEVLKKIESLAASIKKPLVSLFLGARAKKGEPRNLEEAALGAVALAKGEEISAAFERLAERDSQISEAAGHEAARLKKGRRYIRGLFSGGTFCAEAQVILSDPASTLYSNVPAGKTQPLSDPLKSSEHTLIDMGDDVFTSGRPHPMIDYTLRNKRIHEEAADPGVAVILLDVVLGYGANMDPGGELVPVVKEAAGKVCVVCSVTGTPKDPQDAPRVTALLEEAGARVMPSNAAACKMAGLIARSRAG